MRSASLADRSFERILLIKLSSVGDVIHTIPLLNALRRRYPAARIDWLSKPTPAEFIRDLPALNQVLLYGENQTEAPQYKWDGVTHFAGLIRDRRFLATLSRLRAARYDLVIDMQGQMKSGFVSMVTGAPVRIGFDRPRREVWQVEARKLPPGAMKHSWKGAREGSWMAYTHRVRLPTLAIHAIDRYLLVGDLLGIEQEAPDFSIPIRAEAEERLDTILREHVGAMSRPPIVITPGSLWETKRWRPEGFAAVARHFVANGFPVIIDGAANQVEECRRIADQAPGSVVLAGLTSLAELAALIRRSAVVVTNDSGPLHLATALGRPVVAIFGPTNPVWFGPYRRPEALVRAGVPCSPCNIRNLADCPHDHACMLEISPERVIAAIEAKLPAVSDPVMALD
jgi:heptosyltransferase-1